MDVSVKAAVRRPGRGSCRRPGEGVARILRRARTHVRCPRATGGGRRSVLVLEAQDDPGGAVRSAELEPGFADDHSDPTRSPTGTESLWASTNVPQDVDGDECGDGLEGAWDDDQDQRFADRFAIGALLTRPFYLEPWFEGAFVAGFRLTPSAARAAALVGTMTAGADVLQYGFAGLQLAWKRISEEGDLNRCRMRGQAITV